MKPPRLSPKLIGNIVTVFLSEEAGIDQDMRLWFNPRGYRSVLELINQVIGLVVACDPNNELTIAPFACDNHPSERLHILIPSRKIQRIVSHGAQIA